MMCAMKWRNIILSQSDYTDKITLLKGDASQVLTELTGEYDLVFLDGPKGQYLKTTRTHFASCERRRRHPCR